MIISESADNLLSTALLLLSNSAKEHNFLLLHGGLHCGPVLKRDNEYFGSAINFTARIAAKAEAGTFWCSKEFRDSIKDSTLCALEPMGTHELKNMLEEKEVFQLVSDPANFLTIDPVCRMLILSKQKAIPHPREREVFFCSENCLEIYESNKISKNPGALRST